MQPKPFQFAKPIGGVSASPEGARAASGIAADPSDDSLSPTPATTKQGRLSFGAHRCPAPRLPAPARGTGGKPHCLRPWWRNSQHQRGCRGCCVGPQQSSAASPRRAAGRAAPASRACPRRRQSQDESQQKMLKPSSNYTVMQSRRPQCASWHAKMRTMCSLSWALLLGSEMGEVHVLARAMKIPYGATARRS